MKLGSYLEGRWVEGHGEGRPLVNPVSGETLAWGDSSGLDMRAAVDFARARGAVLRDMSFAQRGALLNAVAGVLVANREKYEMLARLNSGNTKLDAAIDIDGAIGTLKYYSRLGKTLGDAHIAMEAGQDQLAKDPVFFARHIWTSRSGVAIQINAFNFPSWGLWEKVAAAVLAGVPSFAKPATATALLSHEMMRDVIAAGVAPEGALNLVCGSAEGLLDAIQPMDSVAFTGSADTGLHVRSHPAVLASGARATIEADSVNATILGPDSGPGTSLFDLAVREVVKAVSVKAGQLCTNIRRVLVPRAHIGAFVEAVVSAAKALKVGDPIDEAVRVGPVVNKKQQAEAFAGIERLKRESRLVLGGATPAGLGGEASAFVAPTVLVCNDPSGARVVHEIEVFGPCVTIMPYEDVAQAATLAIRGGGSLAVSLLTNDPSTIKALTLRIAPWHGRIMVVDEVVGRQHTGHAIVMPQCVHGGPGRAGGGEELGGLRGLRLHMQRSAIQGSPSVFEHLASDAATVSL